MNTEIKNAIQAADSEAQYDESAKRLLAQKYVLAHIVSFRIYYNKGNQRTLKNP